MRLILALVAAGALAACSHRDTEMQPGPETGQATTDSVPAARPHAGAIDTTRTGTNPDASSMRRDTTSMPPMHKDSSSMRTDASSTRHDSL